jgi:DNA repair ATPase RecN
MRLAHRLVEVIDLFRREQKTVDPMPVIDAVELRKRLLGGRSSTEAEGDEAVQSTDEKRGSLTQPAQSISNKSAISNGLQGISGPKPDAVERVNTMSQIAQPSAPSAVAKMFEPTEVFQERLSKLGTAFDQVERLAKDATSAFAQVSELADHLGQFAAAYAPVKKFQSEVGALAQKFDPFKGVHNQLTEMSSSFRDHLHYLAAVLEPVTNVQRRLSELAATLEPVVEVKKRFQALEREFETAGTPSPAGSAQSVSPSGANGSATGRRA